MTHRIPTADTARHQPPTGENPAATHQWLILAVIGVAQLMVVLDATIVNIALPSAQADLGFSTENRPWIITAYSLAFGSLLLLGGRLSDMIGRRRTLLIGLLGFAAASALGGAATGFGLLVAARGLQGVFAAILAPAALSTLNVTFVNPKDRSKAFAVYGAIAASGAVVGLLLGGFLTQYLSWRWCLYVNLAFALPAAAGVLAFVAAKEYHRSHTLDIPGVLSASGGLFCLVYGLSNAQTHGWSAPLTVGTLVAGAVLLIAFVGIESRVSEPLLPPRILADRNRVGSYVAIAIAFCAMFAAFLFLTFYLQQNLGYSPLKTGLAFLPLSVGIAMSAGLANGLLVPRVGPRPLVPAGMLAAAGAMFWLSHLTVSSTYTADVLAPLFLLGAGVGMTFIPALDAATAGVATADAGVASAMVNTSQQIGGAVGTAALSTIFVSALKRYLTNHAPPGPEVAAAAGIHGYTVAFQVSCALFLAGMVLTAALLRSGPLPEHADHQDPPVEPPAPDTDPFAVQQGRPRPTMPATTGLAGTRPPSRAAELLAQGFSRDAVSVILDLEYRNTQLEAANRRLTEKLHLATLHRPPGPTTPRPARVLRVRG
jgi:EmrB/QacA subfamily drug resistance transporter